MSKKTRGTTKDANRRRERHARSERARRLAQFYRAGAEFITGRLFASRPVLGRDVVLKFNGQEIKAVPASVLDWHTGPGVH